MDKNCNSIRKKSKLSLNAAITNTLYITKLSQDSSQLKTTCITQNAIKIY